jgi:hypothetical protein
MRDFFQAVFSMLALFLMSVAGSYAFATLIKRAKRTHAPPENAKVRVRATNGVYRSRFLRETEAGWQFSAPICRDAYVPFRVGEELTMELADEDGILRFRTVVLDRDANEHIFTMRKPTQVIRDDRRAEERYTEYMGQTCKLDETEASILNVSKTGICVVSDQRLNPGERVQLSLPFADLPTFGYVVGREGAQKFCKLRIRFDAPVALPIAA